jgi:hypothetical protein
VSPEQFAEFFGKRVADLILAMGELDRTMRRLIETLEREITYDRD